MNAAFAASHGWREAPRRVVRGRRAATGEVGAASRRQAIVGERLACAGSARARPQGGRGVPQAEPEVQPLRRAPKGARGLSRRAILKAGAH